MKKLLHTGLFALSLFLLSACLPMTGPASVDVSKATCETISSVRAEVLAEYKAKMETISDAYWAARQVFQTELRECMSKAWTQNICESEWQDLQGAYETAMGNISNDDAYNDYKAKQQKWNDCRGDLDAAMENWKQDNLNKEKACQEAFQTKVDQAQTARQAEETKANTKKDSDLAYLAKLEEECKKKGGGGGDGDIGVVGGGGTGTTGGGTTTGGIKTTYEPGSAACTGGFIPGENGTPRTGRASDFGPKDIAINLALAVAEDVTKTPLPVSAIDDRIFAGIVCTKLYSRILELQMEELDAEASNNRPAQIRLRQQIDRYRKAKDVWCTIAQGKATAAQVQSDAAVIGQMPTGACQTAADCGTPVCCSAEEVGQWACNSGACVATKVPCTNPMVCAGKPAACVNPPQKIKALSYGGKFIPLDQVHSGSGPECDESQHWHANGGTVRATDGSTLSDPAPDGCGFGKVGSVPVVEVEAPSYGIEVRMGF